MKNQTITVQLTGGIGNQLFGYFAGRYLATSLGVPLQLDLSKNKLPHGSDIRSLGISEQVLDLDSSTKLSSKIWQHGLNGIGNLSERLRPAIENHLNMYTSRTTGFDHTLDRVKVGMLVRGYFQSYYYWDWDTIHNGRYTPELLTASDWFNLESHVALEQKPIMVHVRRGDYTLPANADRFGLLSMGYYQNALKALQEKFSLDNPIWIFSDDIRSVKEEWDLREFKDVRFISPPLGGNPVESLILMSKGAANVISNSTFSWWAAAFSANSPVVSPDSWYKNMPDPENLIPNDWLRANSVWI